MSILGDFLSFVKRDRHAEIKSVLAEVKALKEEYKQDTLALRMKEVEITMELNAIKESELRCMQRLVDVNSRVRDLEEEVIVLRDWQNNRPKQ
jgi:hypothetical protein